MIFPDDLHLNVFTFHMCVHIRLDTQRSTRSLIALQNATFSNGALATECSFLLLISFILKACWKLIYVYNFPGQRLHGQLYRRLKMNEYTKWVKSFSNKCPFKCSPNLGANEG